MKTELEMIDLTHIIEEGMTTFDAPWHPHVSIKQLGRLGFEGRETRKISLGTHTGTHVDAPLHFVKNGKTIDKIPLSKLVGSISIINFSHLKKNQPVTKEMLKKIKITKKMVFNFGWSRFFGNKKFYHNYPYFTKDAVKFLVSKKIELLGYDTPSPDNSQDKLGSKEDSPIHKILLKKNIVLVEYLANLDKLTNYNGWKIAVSPLRIKDADGSPARVFIFR